MHALVVVVRDAPLALRVVDDAVHHSLRAPQLPAEQRAHCSAVNQRMAAESPEPFRRRLVDEAVFRARHVVALQREVAQEVQAEQLQHQQRDVHLLSASQLAATARSACSTTPPWPAAHSSMILMFGRTSMAAS